MSIQDFNLNSEEGKASWLRVRARLKAFAKLTKEWMNSPEYRAAEKGDREWWQTTLDLLTRYDVPQPETIDEWEYLAHLVEIPAETIGNLTPREIFVRARAWQDRLKIVTAELKGDTNADGATDTKQKQRGRRKADYETVQSEAQLAAEWVQARESGVHKADFAKQHKMKFTQLDLLLNRVAKRKFHSEK